ncbi:hypothetical protein BJ322DRAFT_1082184 [Thelephora terrestris]|uniref:FBD domain-containing protein n=1 Tax=Thelephora terrestris TaxID=56493 RepID=A0A9P6L2V2_9AGAM|nr:hypothetical protein BJ322DRAFT_1082184 [Thelephora terrestris]
MSTRVVPVLAKHFSCHLPLLENLTINVKTVPNEFPCLPDQLFDGDLSSLRELHLSGVLISLPRKNMPNLTTLNLCSIPDDRFLLTRLLNLFEFVPHIRHVRLLNSIPSSSDVPANRMLTLPHLKKFEITAQPAHSILLNHLFIPAGASLILECSYTGDESPIPSYLPTLSTGLLNLSNITTINLCFGPERRFLQLYGPSGELRFLGNWIRGRNQSEVGTSSFLRSMGQFNISRSRCLAVQWYHCGPPADSITRSIVYQTLRSMENLSSLTLVQCKSSSFILALNPTNNPSAIVRCPKLKEITLYTEGPNDIHVNELVKMAEERASRGGKLSVITIVSTGAIAPPKDVFQLRKYVLRLECKFDDAPPEWDTLPL